MKKHLVYLGVIVLLLIFISFNRCGHIETKTTTTSTIDSTTVDSLVERIQYLESIPPETTRVEIPIPQEPNQQIVDDQGDSVNVYNTSYRDSLLVANWELGLTGTLKYQKFEYIPKATPVIRETVTKYQTQYRTTTKTITKQTGGFVSIGGDIGYSTLSNSLGSISIRYQAKDGYSYHYRYDPFLDGHYIGLTIPIRINIPFL